MEKPSGPYFEDGAPIARESAIIFCDILGYKKAVADWSKSGGQSDELIRFYSALSQSVSLVDDPSGSTWIVKMLADSVVVAYPYLRPVGSWEFSQACWNALHFQLNMIRSGVIVRGGISLGKIHVSDMLVFPSLNVLEEGKIAESTAHYPRIVLMDSAINFLRANRELIQPNHLDKALVLDSDGYYYLNYLWPLRIPIPSDRPSIVKAHRALIEEKLREFDSDQRIRCKYRWMANYHNQFCRAIPQFGSTEYHVIL